MLTPVYDKLYTKAFATYTHLVIFLKCKIFLHLNYICLNLVYDNLYTKAFALLSSMRCFG